MQQNEIHHQSGSMMISIYRANNQLYLPSGRRADPKLRSPYESGFSMTVSNKTLKSYCVCEPLWRVTSWPRVCFRTSTQTKITPSLVLRPRTTRNLTMNIMDSNKNTLTSMTVFPLSTHTRTHMTNYTEAKVSIRLHAPTSSVAQECLAMIFFTCANVNIVFHKMCDNKCSSRM